VHYRGFVSGASTGLERALKRLWVPVIVVVLIVSLMPIYLQVIGALGPSTDIVERRLWPTGLSFTALQRAVDAGALRWLGNSVFLTALAVAGHLLVAGLAAYAFAWKGAPSWLFWLLVGSMIVPDQALFIPRFILVRKLGLSGYSGLLLAYWSCVASIFLLRQFCKSLPKDVLEAARLDGAKEWRLILRFAFPMMAPGLALCGAWVFALVWGDLFWPSLMLRGSDMTLSLGLYFMTQTSNLFDPYARAGMVMAGGMLSLIPMAIIFSLFQGYLGKGHTEAWTE
jgi:ABC-type glycerol-3-phosphate transport system permease component